MGVYHFVLVHFPIALWIGASLLIFLRVVNDGPVGQAADRALPVFLVGLASSWERWVGSMARRSGTGRRCRGPRWGATTC